MLGRIELENFKACELNQEAASAWSAVENLLGANYKPLLYLGRQVAKGIDYFFIAEVSTIAVNPIRHVVAFTVNAFNGSYEILEGSFETIL